MRLWTNARGKLPIERIAASTIVYWFFLSTDHSNIGLISHREHHITHPLNVWNFNLVANAHVLLVNEHFNIIAPSHLVWSGHKSWLVRCMYTNLHLGIYGSEVQDDSHQLCARWRNIEETRRKVAVAIFMNFENVFAYHLGNISFMAFYGEYIWSGPTE